MAMESGALLMPDDHVKFFGDTIRVIRLEANSGYAPVMTPEDAMDKFEQFISTTNVHKLSSCTPILDECIANPLKCKSGSLKIVFNDFEHFASCMLGNNLDRCEVSWNDYASNDSNAHYQKIFSTSPDEAGLCNVVVKCPIRISSTSNDKFMYDCDQHRVLLDDIILLNIKR